MSATQQSCNLRFMYFGSDGYAHCVAECGQYYTVQWSPNPDGPWYFDRNGEVGQDIPIEPMPGVQRYYRVIPREVSQLPEPEPEPE